MANTHSREEDPSGRDHDFDEQTYEKTVAQDPGGHDMDSVIDALEDADDFLERPACKGFADSLKSLRGRETPKAIGPYRILMKLGEGGMGIVYLAQQDKPIRRRVALKVMKSGLASGQALARFSSELQALAYMNHPYIDTVFDSGITDEGCPFFTTSYLNGLPITQFCDHYQVSLEDRLILFEKVCEGVQHAHRRGIIHRDLKPSNIMVVRQGEQLIPKIIDFGICKPLSGESLTDLTVFTKQGMFVGTPAYMSPEQVDGDIADLDTRSDVYSLGVVLYELLCGVLPHDQKELGVSFSKLLRIIATSDPPLPSTRVRSLQAAETGMGISRQALGKRLRNDLDQVVAKALAKNRTNRYETPSELAADLRRFRDHKPVIATKPSLMTRVGKFFRRNRFSFVSALVAFFSVVLGVLFLVLGYFEAVAAEKRERKAKQDLESTVRRLETFDGIFYSSLFSAPNPYNKNADIRVRDVLERVALNIDSMDDDPEIVAYTEHMLGKAYYHLRITDKAEFYLKRALDSRMELLGARDMETLETMLTLGQLYLVNDAFDAALSLVASIEVALEDQDTHALSIDVAILKASCLKEKEAYDQALMIYDWLLSVTGNQYLREPILRATLYEGKAISHHRRGDYEDAESYYLKALTLVRDQNGATDPHYHRVQKNLGDLYFDYGRFEEAEPLVASALQNHLRYLGARHPTTLGSFESMGLIFLLRGNYSEAVDVFREISAIQGSGVGVADHRSLDSEKKLAMSLSMAGSNLEAMAIFARLREHAIALEGWDSAAAISMTNNLADCLKKLGRYREAVTLLNQALDVIAAGDLPNLPEVRCTLAESLLGLGNAAEAETQYCHLMTTAEAYLPADDLWLALFRLSYGRFLTEVGRFDDAHVALSTARDVLVQKGCGEIVKAEGSLDELFSAWVAGPSR